MLDQERRLALTRYHTVLHVLNTIALRDYGGWITGVQISADYSRIDFKLDSFSPALCAELERKVNAVLAENHALRSYYLPEEEFRRRDDLLRTLEAKPPVLDGRVRVVEIEGFDAQACGGTHVSNTSELGRLFIFRTENKGKINKRLYVRLERADG
jgi:misacylated tRNA(Ala) deacylase